MLSSAPRTLALISLVNGVIEAAWLTAVAIVPCLCNPYVENNFGPEKAALLHGLALLTSGAWLVRLGLKWQKGVEYRNEREIVSPWRRWWAWFLAAFLISSLLSTCLSVDPTQSFWGDWKTRWGTYTLLSCVMLFIAILFHLRSREQIERFVTAVLVGSLAVALYAILQKLRWDPIHWQAMTSLVGHPLYIAAYLGMVLPLCVWRISNLLPGLTSQPWSSPKSNKLLAVSLGFYCLLAVLQFVALLLANERGPVLALLGASVCFLVLVSAFWNLRRLLPVTFSIAGAVIVFLVLLNIPGGPLQPLRSWRVLERFSHGLFSAREGTGLFRAGLWKEAPKLMLSSQPVLRPGGAKDTLVPVRFWLGYGPESCAGVLAQRYTVPKSGATLEDRFHNRVWDLWQSVGALGTIAFLGFFAALYHCGLRQLGLVSRRADSLLFCGLLFGFSLLGALVLSLWQGYGFCGLGLQLGLAAGCVLYPISKLGSPVQDSKPGLKTSGVGSGSSSSVLLIIALLSACLMHLVETGFAFPTASTATLFWAFAGLLVAIHYQAETPHSQPHGFAPVAAAASSAPASAEPKGQKAKSAAKSHRQKGHSPAQVLTQRTKSNVFLSALFPAALITLLLVPLINMFLLRYTHALLSSSDFVTYALQRSQPGDAGTNGAPDFLLAVWLGSAWLLAGPRFTQQPNKDRSLPATAREGSGPGWAGGFIVALMLSGALAGIYAVWCGSRLAAIGPLPQGLVEGWNLVNQSRGYELLYWSSMVVILVLVLLCAYACSGISPAQLRKPSLIGLLAGLSVLVSAGAIGTDVSSCRADIAVRWAGVLHNQNLWPACNEVFERAVHFSPREFIYRSKLARALRDQAAAAQDPAAWNQLNHRAEEMLQAAKELPGYNRHTWHLGELYLDWAQRETNPARQLELAQKAKSCFEEALLWEPKNPPVWSDYAYVNIALLHNEEEGLRQNQKALDLDPGCEQAHSRFADYYAQRSASAPDAETRRLFASKAVKSYALAAGNGPKPFPYLMAGGSLLMGQQEWSKAIERFKVACEFADNTQAAQAEEMLARAYLGAGNQAAAVEHLNLAIGKASPERRAALLDLESKISTGH